MRYVLVEPTIELKAIPAFQRLDLLEYFKYRQHEKFLTPQRKFLIFKSRF